MTKDNGAIVAVIACALLSGCASSPSGRQGLFDRWGRFESGEGSVRTFRGKARPKGDRVPAEVAKLADGFRWPLKRVRVTSAYGHRDSGFHEGVDLKASTGTPVYAAGKGTVVYAGARIRGYGWMVVIAHKGSLVTVYAHASRLAVKKGTQVKRGQIIAYSGQSGRASGPHLHFEIRHGVTPYNPEKVFALASDSRKSMIAKLPRGGHNRGDEKSDRSQL